MSIGINDIIMNTIIKCFFCNSVFENTESIKLLRGDSIFLKKYSLICSDCKDSNVFAHLSQINDSVDAISHLLKQVNTDSKDICSRIYSLECKLGLISSSFDHMAGVTDNIADSISNNSKTFAHYNVLHEKFVSKMSNFIDKYDSTVVEAGNAKLDIIASKLNTSISQLTISNQHLSDNIEQCKSTTKTINQHFLSNSEDITRLSNELRSTMDFCNELSNSLTILKPSIVRDFPNSTSIQQELSLADACVINNNQVLPHCHLTASDVNINTNGIPKDTIPHAPSCLQVAPRPKYIFVSRLSSSTSHIDVISHVKSILGLSNIIEHHNLIKCRKVSRLNSPVASFKITVPETMLDLLMSPTSWPASTYLQEFVDLSKKNGANKVYSAPKN